MIVKVLKNLLSVKTKSVDSIFKSRLKSCSNSAAHTLKVAERIKIKREEALLGGGQKRIDQQHKKVGRKGRCIPGRW